jgi:lysophospholipase L1-like esterase
MSMLAAPWLSWGVLTAVALVFAACGGGAASAPSPGASAPSAGTNAVAGLVFYDQNANGALDSDEQVRLPDVRVAIGTQTGSSDSTGRFTVSGLPGGAQTVAIQVDSLPPYFQQRPIGVTLPLPSGSVLPVPVTLPIGGNRPNRYLAFGDSITAGTGSEGHAGWTVELERRLRERWGAAEMLRDGVPGSRSIDGVERLPAMLAEDQPAFTLLLYGTNDWNRCQYTTPEACYTVPALRDMIGSARRAGSLPVVGTIIPANPLFTERDAAERNRWIQAENDLVRAMVQQEGAVLAETWLAFGADQSAWPPLFFDHIHPADDGYTRITEAFFRAIARARGTR